MLFKKAQSKLKPNWNRKKSSNRKTNNFYIRFEILKKQAMLFLLEEVFLDPHRLSTSPNYAQIGSCFHTKVAARSRRVFCNPMRQLWLSSCGIWQVAIADSRLRFVCWQSAGPNCTWTWRRWHTERGLGLCPHLFILAYRVLQLLLVVGRLYQCRPRPHKIQVPWKFNGFGTATPRITTETLLILVNMVYIKEGAS